MAYLIFGLIALILLGLVAGAIAIAYGIGGAVFGWLFRSSALKNLASKWAGIASALASATFIGYSLYGAVYPPDEFYLSEFQTVTMRQPPKSAEVLSKSASYPDLHGDYCSFSRIKLSMKDFEDLLQNIAADSSFKAESIVGSAEEDTVHKSLPSIPILKEYTRPELEHPDHYFGIRFLNSKEHVEVSICVT